MTHEKLSAKLVVRDARGFTVEIPDPVRKRTGELAEDIGARAHTRADTHTHARARSR